MGERILETFSSGVVSEALSVRPSMLSLTHAIISSHCQPCGTLSSNRKHFLEQPYFIKYLRNA
jgi:hypothetical protein